METLKHLSSDYELINTNACSACASAQCESSTQTFRREDQKDKEIQGGKKGRRRNNNVCLNNGCPDCSS